MCCRYYINYYNNSRVIIITVIHWLYIEKLMTHNGELYILLFFTFRKQNTNNC